MNGVSYLDVHHIDLLYLNVQLIDLLYLIVHLIDLLYLNVHHIDLLYLNVLGRDHLSLSLHRGGNGGGAGTPPQQRPWACPRSPWRRRVRGGGG